MKKEDGISMFEVVISIIILLLIAFFAVYNAKNSVPQAKATELYSEMQSVELVVEFVKSKIVADSSFDPKAADELGNYYDTFRDGKCVIYGVLKHNDCSAAKFLGLEGLKRDYIIDYENGKFELSEAVNIQGIDIKTLAELNSMINIGIK